MVSKSEAAYRQLKSDISNGKFRPRERLIEQDLSQYLGVSRPTVRAVLIRLEADGIVVTERNRGSSVRAYTLAEAVQTFRVREVLEGLAARLAAENATEEGLGELRRLIAEMETVVASGNLPAYPPLNAAFHQVILKMAADDQVTHLITSLNHSLIRFQYRTVFVPGRTAASLMEHKEILAKIAAHDGDGAEQAIRFHVAQVRANMALTVGLPVYWPVA